MQPLHARLTRVPPSSPFAQSRQANGDLHSEDAAQRQALQVARRLHCQAEFEMARGHGGRDAEVAGVMWRLRSCRCTDRPSSRAPPIRRRCRCERCACETCRDEGAATAQRERLIGLFLRAPSSWGTHGHHATCTCVCCCVVSGYHR